MHSFWSILPEKREIERALSLPSEHDVSASPYRIIPCYSDKHTRLQVFHFFQTDLAESGLPANTVAVVSLAGQNVLDPTRRWTPGFKQNVWASRVNTTQSLVQAVIRGPVKPKVFISISGVGKIVRSIIYWSPTIGEEF
jgi:hypothetical protein